MALALDELAKRPRSVSRDILERSDTALGHAVFDLTAMVQAHVARASAEKKTQEQHRSGWQT